MNNVIQQQNKKNKNHTSLEFYFLRGDNCFIPSINSKKRNKMNGNENLKLFTTPLYVLKPAIEREKVHYLCADLCLHMFLELPPTYMSCQGLRAEQHCSPHPDNVWAHLVHSSCHVCMCRCWLGLHCLQETSHSV